MTPKPIQASCMLLALLAGCSTRIGDFTAISTKNLYAKNVNVAALPRKEGVEGADIRFLGGSTIQEALDRALEAGQGNLMIDAALYVDTYPFFGGFRIRGTVVNIPYTKDRYGVASPQKNSVLQLTIVGK